MERVTPEKRREGMQGWKSTYRIADCIAIPSKPVLGGGHVALTGDSGGGTRHPKGEKQSHLTTISIIAMTNQRRGWVA